MANVTIVLSEAELERLERTIEQGEACFVEARNIISANTVSSLNAGSGGSKGESPDVNGIRWKVKGGRLAQPSDVFAFEFTQNRDGTTPSERASLVKYLKAHGALSVDEFEITMSKDGKFLQRKRM